jgi:hypothetical protein
VWVARSPRNRYILAAAGIAGRRTEIIMRAEIQGVVNDIKQSIGLLRRHL